MSFRYLCFGSILLALGCEREEVAPHSQGSTTPRSLPAQHSEPVASASAPPLQSASPEPELAVPPADAAPAFSMPELTAEDGGTLAQTEDEPKTDSEYFKVLSQKLFEAIVKDDPELAKPFFFPLVAYREVKAIAKPDRDYKLRLIAHFERDIHDYHKKLGKSADEAKLISIEVPADRAKWMKPGSEGNKLGYYRVLRSQLKYTDADGKEHALEITSFISWRGHWYVVHLNGFK